MGIIRKVISNVKFTDEIKVCSTPVINSVPYNRIFPYHKINFIDFH